MRRRRVAQRFDVAERNAEEPREERGVAERAPRRFRHRAQEIADLVRLERGEEPALPIEGVRDAARAESVAHGARVGPSRREHHDVARRERARLAAFTEAERAVQEALRFERDRVGVRALVRLRCDRMDHERRRVRAVLRLEHERVATRADQRVVRDVVAEEAFATDHGVVSGDESRRRAVAKLERDRLSRGGHGSPRVDVGADVGAAEAVDRLLRIADQIERVRTGAFEEDAAEDRPLRFVGVLELVDERALVAAAQLRERGAFRVAGEGAAELVEEVVVVDEPFGRFAPVQSLADER